ncbi:MAG: hypothetical protein QNJ97_17510 [Myxococcota bacterium]|nr:hypothetical protein [Myxococcota bacterium]
MHRAYLMLALISVHIFIACSADKKNNQEASDGHLDGDACKIESKTPVGWEDQTDIGVPKDIFSDLAGTCEAPFKWDGFGWQGSGLSIAPDIGEGSANAAVQVDESSVVFVQTKPTHNSVDDDMCEDYLMANAQVTIEILDSPVVSNKEVEINAYSQNQRLDVSFTLNEADIRSWDTGAQAVAISTESGVTNLGMNIELMPLGAACVGEARFTTTESLGAGTAVSSNGPFGFWSNTGCGMWEQIVDITQLVDIETLQSEITETFDDRPFNGFWQEGEDQEDEDQEDGDPTILRVAVTLLQTEICSETEASLDAPLDVPVELVANTDDGIIKDLVGDGSVPITIDSQGIQYIGALQAMINLQCQSETDSLPVTTADCSIVDSIEAQLYTGDPREDDGELSLYIYHRDGNPNGAPDEVLQLLLDNDG